MHVNKYISTREIHKFKHQSHPMEKKEAYQHLLPHFQQPGQAWLVTFCLWDAVAQDTLRDYTNKLSSLTWKIDNRKRRQLYDQRLKELEQECQRNRRLYFNAYDRLMAKNTDRTIDLTREEIREIIIDTITQEANVPLENYAWCIMPNHVHWVFRIRERDYHGNPVYLSDILASIKEKTTRKINHVLGRKGSLWQKESFETTIRNHQKLVRAIEFTLNNPVAAHLVNDRSDWPGSWENSSL